MDNNHIPIIIGMFIVSGLLIYIIIKLNSNSCNEVCDSTCQDNISKKVASLVKIPSGSCDVACQKGISDAVSKNLINSLTPVINKQTCDSTCQDNIACRVLNNKYFTHNNHPNKGYQVSLGDAIGNIGSQVMNIQNASPTFDSFNQTTCK